jgi:transposase InsO family protein
VRSSATAEDLPGAAFAGQHDTSLNVVGEAAVLDAVRLCWASLWTDRAVAYRRQRGVDARAARMAVVVQAMVEADTAGVMLTANPVTGARDELVVEASGGLGEAVVSGMVTPDHYRLSPDGTVLESRWGRREVVIRSAPDGGTTEEVGQEGDTERLSDESLRELARLGTALADHFSRPQDIEWAYSEGKIWLLQARPLTAVPPAPITLTAVQRFTGPVIAELFPIRPYPMDMSAWTIPGVGELVHRMLRGLPAVRFDFGDVVPEVEGVVDRFVPPNPRPTFATLFTPLRLARRLRSYDPAHWRADPRYQRFDREVAALARRDVSELDWETLCGQPRESLAQLDRMATTRVDDQAAKALPDLVGRRFTATRPNQTWVADLTYVSTGTGFCYLALITDVFSRLIVGWAIGVSLHTNLPLAALEMALWRREPANLEGLVHHSDRGSQYTSVRYADRLDLARIAASVGSVGDSYDNALAETTIGLYKTELIDRHGPWQGRDHVELATLEYINWYNNRRLHGACRDVPPVEYEAAYWAANPARNHTDGIQ